MNDRPKSVQIGAYKTLTVSRDSDGKFTVVTGLHDEGGWSKDPRIHGLTAGGVRAVLFLEGHDAEDTAEVEAWLALYPEE
jgi:hypothetical protein